MIACSIHRSYNVKSNNFFFPFLFSVLKKKIKKKKKKKKKVNKSKRDEKSLKQKENVQI